ncbi:MAG: MBL fold metallo-hydrolase [Sphaerochaetaceae bacterium]|jgi:7,8-dihydropterin-6-yl-methyl-4-(beta-D-ribofuranosyl)aminobenzene 5'-phosphate synthase
MIKLTTLVENKTHPSSSLKYEHGFSMLVEKGDKKILFDTGKSDLFIENSEKLNINLNSIDHLVISHGHYDHSGGVKSLLEKYRYDNLKMWTGRGFEDKKYSDEKPLRYLGIDFDHEFVSKHNVIWHSVCAKTVMIEKGVWLVSKFDSHYDFEEVNPRFVVKRYDGTVEIDDFSDEVALVADSPKGLVVIVGCSHPGILSIIKTIENLFSKPIYALIGGIHLYDASDEKREKVLKELVKKKITLLGACHCTGSEALGYLKEKCKGFYTNITGTVTEI